MWIHPIFKIFTNLAMWIKKNNFLFATHTYQIEQNHINYDSKQVSNSLHTPYDDDDDKYYYSFLSLGASDFQRIKIF